MFYCVCNPEKNQQGLADLIALSRRMTNPPVATHTIDMQ
jgi:hypothetical protein